MRLPHLSLWLGTLVLTAICPPLASAQLYEKKTKNICDCTWAGNYKGPRGSLSPESTFGYFPTKWNLWPGPRAITSAIYVPSTPQTPAEKLPPPVAPQATPPAQMNLLPVLPLPDSQTPDTPTITPVLRLVEPSTTPPPEGVPPLDWPTETSPPMPAPLQPTVVPLVGPEDQPPVVPDSGLQIIPPPPPLIVPQGELLPLEELRR